MQNETIKTIMRRYSCRAFTDKLVSAEDLRTIALAAVAAPSGMNRQPWRIIVLTDKKLIAEMETEGMRILAEMEDKTAYNRIMARGGKLFYNAQSIVFVALAKPEPASFEKIDCGIVAENIALAATSLNIDNVICAFASLCFTDTKGEDFKRRLGFPKGYEFGISVLLGYAAKPDGKPHEPDLTKICFVG